MHTFKSVVIVKHPVDEVWTCVRDHICELAPRIKDIDSVTVLSREEPDDGITRFKNEWRLDFNLPKISRSIVSPDDLGWIDYATWNDATHVCQWKIEPFFKPECVNCEGETSYESAIGGRATRIVFHGNVELDLVRISKLTQSISVPLSSVIENVVTKVVPRNFRKIYVEAEHWLKQQ